MVMSSYTRDISRTGEIFDMMLLLLEGCGLESCWIFYKLQYYSFY